MVMLSKLKTRFNLKKWADSVGRLLKGHPKNPRLPVELERIIFEHAAHQNRSGIPSLMRVASRVKQWVEPILYEIIIPGQPPYLPPSNSGAAIYGKFVRHLSLRDDMPSDLARSYLSSCPNLWSLSFVTDKLAEPRLDRYSTYAFPAYPRPPTYFPAYKFPAYQHLTHLELLTYSPRHRINWLSELPNLAYLLISSSMSNLNQVTKPIFMRCPKIRVILWCPWKGGFSNIGEPTTAQIQAINLEELEPRLVVVRMSSEQYTRHFVALAEGKWNSENAWKMAEEIVNKRLETGTTDYGDIVTLPGP